MGTETEKREQEKDVETQMCLETVIHAPENGGAHGPGGILLCVNNQASHKKKNIFKFTLNIII